MRLATFLPGDERRFVARADFSDDFAELGEKLPGGPKFALLNTAGQVVGVGGFMTLQRADQRGAWAFLSELSPQQWVQAARLARTEVERIWALGNSVYATPAAGDAAQRLLAYIGFRPSPDDAGVWKFHYRLNPSRRAA